MVKNVTKRGKPMGTVSKTFAWWPVRITVGLFLYSFIYWIYLKWTGYPLAPLAFLRDTLMSGTVGMWLIILFGGCILGGFAVVSSTFSWLLFIPVVAFLCKKSQITVLWIISHVIKFDIIPIRGKDGTSGSFLVKGNSKGVSEMEMLVNLYGESHIQQYSLRNSLFDTGRDEETIKEIAKLYPFKLGNKKSFEFLRETCERVINPQYRPGQSKEENKQIDAICRSLEKESLYTLQDGEKLNPEWETMLARLAPENDSIRLVIFNVDARAMNEKDSREVRNQLFLLILFHASRGRMVKIINK